MNVRIYKVFEKTLRSVDHDDEMMSEFMQEFAERLAKEIADYCEELDGGEENYYSRNIREEFEYR